MSSTDMGVRGRGGTGGWSSDHVRVPRTMLDYVFQLQEDKVDGGVLLEIFTKLFHLQIQYCLSEKKLRSVHTKWCLLLYIAMFLGGTTWPPDKLYNGSQVWLPVLTVIRETCCILHKITSRFCLNPLPIIWEKRPKQFPSLFASLDTEKSCFFSIQTV